MGDKNVWSPRDSKYVDAAYQVICHAVGSEFGYQDYLLDGIELSSGEAQSKYCQAFAAFVMDFWDKFDNNSHFRRARDCVTRLVKKHVEVKGYSIVDVGVIELPRECIEAFKTLKEIQLKHAPPSSVDTPSFLPPPLAPNQEVPSAPPSILPTPPNPNIPSLSRGISGAPLLPRPAGVSPNAGGRGEQSTFVKGGEGS